MRTYPILLLCLLLSNQSLAQRAEKIHVHTDKDFYLPGESVFFKAYLVENNSPSSKTNLFAAIYDENGNLLQQKTYPIFNGAATGDFLIPDTTVYSNYQLRLYTRNREVSGLNDFIFPLRVFNKSQIGSNPIPLEENSVQILPEAKNIVLGVNNHIGFQTNTLQVASIVDESGIVVDSVYFDDLGYSRTQLSPQPGKRYFLSWKNKSGEEVRKELPAAQANSVALHTELAGDKIYYSIHKNSKDDAFSQLQLAVNDGPEIIYSEKLQLGDKMQFVNSFPVDSLGSGLFMISLYDANQKLLQKKTVYIPSKKPGPIVTVKQLSTAAKGKTQIEVQVKDPSVTSWSVSVTDEKFIIPELKASIYDGLITGSNSSYFKKALSNSKKADVILSVVPHQNIPLLNVHDNYLSFSAKYNRSLAAGMGLSLMINDKASGKQFYNFNQSSPGNFLVDGLIYYDSAKIYYQLTDKDLTQNLTASASSPPPVAASIQPVHKKDWWISLGNNFIRDLDAVQNFAERKPGKFNELQTISTVVLKSKYVNPITKRMLELDDKYATGMFKGMARGQQLNIVDDPSAAFMLDLFSYLPYRVSGVSVGRNADGAKVFLSRSGTYIVFVDEVETPVELIENIPMSRIAYVKVIPGIVAGSSFVTDAGAIYIYTKRGDEDKSSLTMKSIITKGYSLPSEFINPDYGDPKNAKPADYRTTLYWNPFIITDENNSSFTIEYFNNDVSKRHVLRLVGLNSEGEPVEIEKILE